MKHILLVDDSATMLMSLKSTLEISGFKVDVATDGQVALGKVKSGLKPDLIITDINMPNLDGFGFIEAVRSEDRATPILVLTTESDDAKKERARSAGASGWIVKPFDPDKLVGAVRRVAA